VIWRYVKLVDHKPNKLAIENLFINENRKVGSINCDFWYSNQLSMPFHDPK
jgi:hypothetical protein